MQRFVERRGAQDGQCEEGASLMRSADGEGREGVVCLAWDLCEVCREGCKNQVSMLWCF
jgi:hypothetical protein